MIGQLRGTLAWESPDGTAVIDVGGVGYEVMAPLGTFGRVARTAEGVVTVMVHTHVREDAIVLFAFADDRERVAFRTLTSVAGVGPKIAVSILGALPSAELAAAVARNDAKRLQAVPGVGRKIAERLCLELKDKIASGALTTPTGTPVAPASRSRTSDGAAPLVDALVRLGFRPSDADRAASELRDRAAEPLDAQIRAALRLLTP